MMIAVHEQTLVQVGLHLNLLNKEDVPTAQSEKQAANRSSSASSKVIDGNHLQVDMIMIMILSGTRLTVSNDCPNDYCNEFV